MNRLLSELRRRNVFRVAAAYLVVGWLLMQFAALIEAGLGFPAWFDAMIIAMLALGLPVALLLAWAFEMTPEGMKLSVAAVEGESVNTKTGQTLDMVILTALVVVIALLGWQQFSGSQAGRTLQAGPVLANDLSIAVLPFSDMSEAGDQAYFGDGIAEEILHVLARMPDLKVAGRTSSFRFRGDLLDLRDVGEQLGVAHVLEGSVRKSANRIRITAQLINVEDGFHLWSETYDRDLTDIFAVQEEISRMVADALSISMGADATSLLAGTDNLVAHDLHLRARQRLATRSVEALREAEILFRGALILDPGYSQAHSGLARSLSVLYFYNTRIDIDTVMTAARDEAEAALVLSPDNAEAHSVLGSVNAMYFWDWDAAQAAITRSIELAPNDAEIANFAGDHYRTIRDDDEALRWEQRAVELDPLQAINYTDLAYAYLDLHDCEQALELLQTSRALMPGFDHMDFAEIRIQICLGNFSAAVALLPEDVDEMNAAILLAGDNNVIFVSENIDNFEALIDRAEADPETVRFYAYFLADIRASLGHYPQAARLLEQAYVMRSPQFRGSRYRPLPEDWPDDPAIQAALNKPELVAFYDIRRRNMAAYAARHAE